MVEVYKIIRGVQTILTIWDGANFSKAYLKKSKLKIDAIKLEHYETSLKSPHDAKVDIGKAFF